MIVGVGRERKNHYFFHKGLFYDFKAFLLFAKSIEQ